MSELTDDRPVASEPKSELEQLREEVAFLKSCGIVELAVRNPNVADWMQHWEGRAEKAEAALRSAASTSTEAVGVKALEFADRNSFGDLTRCDTVVGIYRVWTHAEAEGKWFWSLSKGNETENHSPVASKADGVSAAQADYEARILAAIDGSPAAIRKLGGAS